MARIRWLVPLLFLPLIQCQENSITNPEVPDEIPATAIRLHVNLAARTVTQVNVPSSGDVRYSLVGSDAISIQASTLEITPLAKNRVTVRFDVSITNSLSNVTLIPASSRTPEEATGILLFPLQATPTTGSSPITASTDWDGDPFNFLTGGSCKVPAINCYRWEEFPAPLAPGATSTARRVGFEMDKSITEFDVVMLVSADLQSAAATPPVISLSQSTANFSWLSGTTT